MAVTELMNYTVDGNPCETDIEQLHHGLRVYNSQFVEKDYRSFAYVFKTDNGRVIAGVEGGTYWRRLYISNIWVAEDHRRQGIGRQLLTLVERVALERQCRGIDLDTFDFQAPEFYKKLGFRQVGAIGGYHNDHKRIYYSKDI